MRVTITSQQRKRHINIGNRLVQKRYISGFNLEDYDLNQRDKNGALYAHDNRTHIRDVQRATDGGKIYPRESYYRWNPTWEVGQNTQLLFNRTLAHGNEEYFITKNTKKAIPFFENRTFNKISRAPLQHSWDVPDIRLFSISHPNYKTAHNITKKIDHNSRFSTLVTKRKNLNKVRNSMKYERVKKVRIQNYPKYSLFEYIFNQEL